MSRLLDLPHDLLIQEILARLPWPMLSQCLLVNKSLFGTITSSPILIYRRALFLASMVDNPRSSFSLPEKLAILQDRERRWRKLEPKMVLEIKQDAGRGDWLSVAAEDGAIIYANMKGGNVNLSTFPSSLDAESDRMRWNDIPFEGQDEKHIGFCTAIDESDLVAVGFRNKSDGTVDVHLVQYTSKSPHPLASQPILQTKLFPLQHSNGEIGMARDILGVILSRIPNPTDSSDYHLQLWNWKTGTLLGETMVDGESLIFLAEDLLIVPSLRWGLQFYHIAPPSSSSEERIRRIGFLHFPPLGCHSVWDAHIDTWFQPIRLPSPTHTHTPVINANAPFSDDASKTLINIRLRILPADTMQTVYFPMIVQRDKLLEFALRFLSSSGKGVKTKEEEVEWEKWGPPNVRMTGMERYWQGMVAVSGTRWLHVHHPPNSAGNGLLRRNAVIQVMDFGTPKVRRCLERLETGLDPFEEEQRDEERDTDEESDYTAHVEFLHAPQRIDHPVFRDPILTYLPCIQSTLLLKEAFKMPASMLFARPPGAVDDVWKAARDKGDGWERFTGTFWDGEYLSAGCIAGAQKNGDLSLLYFG